MGNQLAVTKEIHRGLDGETNGSERELEIELTYPHLRRELPDYGRQVKLVRYPVHYGKMDGRTAIRISPRHRRMIAAFAYFRTRRPADDGSPRPSTTCVRPTVALPAQRHDKDRTTGNRTGRCARTSEAPHSGGRPRPRRRITNPQKRGRRMALPGKDQVRSVAQKLRLGPDRVPEIDDD